MPNCRVFDAVGLPTLNTDKHALPDDVKEFYDQCGGLVLYEDKDYPVYILPPSNVQLANIAILGENYQGDITSDWYVIAHDGSGEYLVIDFSVEHLGRCYDGFSDGYGLIGETPIIANSFTQLIERLVRTDGNYWYWLDDDFEDMVDAYDVEK